MDLDSKYELGAVAANDSESKTFRARETASGREVFVHILFGGKPPGGGESLLSALAGRMTDPDPAKSAQVLEIGDYKGMPFAVTAVLPGFQGLRAWLEKGRGPLPGPVPPVPEDHSKVRVFKVPGAPVAASVPAPPEDDFDRLFGTEPASAASPLPAAAEAPAPPPPPVSTRQEGEFTRLFRSTLGDIPAAPPAQAPRPPAATPPPQQAPPMAAAPSYLPLAPPPPPPAPQAPQESGPGEFTRMFQSEPSGDSAAMPPEAGAGAGEFTRMFEAAPAPAGVSPVRPPQPQSAPAQPGGFTGLFGTPPSGSRPQGEPGASYPAQGGGSPAQPPQPQSAPAQPGGFTGLFGTPPSGSRPPAEPAASYGMPPAPPLGKAQPMGGKAAGEFTQLFGKPSGAAPGAPAVPPPPAQAQGATGVFATPPAGPSPQLGRPSGPGEYTRVFGAQSSYAATGVAAPQAPPQPPASAPSAGTAEAPAAKLQMPLWPVVIGAAIVLLAALGLLLYFLSKK